MWGLQLFSWWRLTTTPCKSPARETTKVLGDFVEVCGDSEGDMEYGGYFDHGYYEVGQRDDHCCCFFTDATGTVLTLVEENEGNCATNCTLSDVQSVLAAEGLSIDGLVFGQEAAEAVGYFPLMEILRYSDVSCAGAVVVHLLVPCVVVE